VSTTSRTQTGARTARTPSREAPSAPGGPATKPRDMVARLREVASGSARQLDGTATVRRADAPAPTPRQRPVRYTLDLAPAQHRFLKRLALDLETDASLIVRALLSRLEEDSLLRTEIAGAVERRY
jgi:hypothetical protein